MADEKIVTEEALSAISSDIKTALGSKADISSIPTKVSDLTNDSDFQTGDDVDTAISTAIANKADIDGEYDLMTVGLAKQLKSNVGENDKVPYNFRTSGGSIDIGESETDMLVGGSVAFNQLLPLTALPTSGEYSGVTVTNNGDGSITLDGTSTARVSLKNTSLKPLANHVYYIANGQGISFHSSSWSLTVNRNNDYNISKASNNVIAADVMLFEIIEANIVFNNKKIYPQLIDLTQMFGSTIADYIYSLEQGNTGAGVAFFRSLFPKPYYAYNAGELMSVKTSAHRMVGFNQLKLNRTEIITSATASNTTPRVFNENQVWIGLTRNNYFNNTMIDAYNIGADYVSVNSKSGGYGVAFPIRVLPNTTYYGKLKNNWGVGFYDENGAKISDVSKTNESTFTTPENVYWATIVFCPSPLNTLITYEKPCINLSWDGERNGEYEPYEEHTYALDADLELRGIPKLDANNKLYYDGDTYESDGTVTRKFEYRAYASGDESLPDTITDGTHTVTKLVTPTTESADPFTNPQTVNDFGTEEYVDDRAVAVPVGHDTFYQANLRAKLEMTPDSPSGNGDYIVRQTNGQNVYVALTKELPTLPSTDGTYTLKCTVSGGTPTLSWVADT